MAGRKSAKLTVSINDCLSQLDPYIFREYKYNANMKKYLLILLLPVIFETHAQERLQAGKIYNEGETIYAPTVGYKGTIPQGWYGTLPEGEEVFLLLPVDNREAYMFINVHQKTLKQLKEEWNGQFALTPAITITLKRDPKMEAGKMTGYFNVSGSPEKARAYAEAIDGGHGYLFVFILLAMESDFDNFMTGLDQLVQSSTFNVPSITNVYGDFNWSKFRPDKYFVSYVSSREMVQKNHLWICPDGTFKTKIKSGGLVKVKGDKNKYNGTSKGSWTAEGVGPKGTLILKFDNKPPLTVDLEINQEKIYLNGFRYFALHYSGCK